MNRDKEMDREDVKPKVYRELMSAAEPIQNLMTEYGRRNIELEKSIAMKDDKIATLEKDLTRMEKRFHLNDQELRNKEKGYKILADDFRKEKMFQENYRQQLEKKLKDRDERLRYEEGEKIKLEKRIAYLESKLKETERECNQLRQQFNAEYTKSRNTNRERYSQEITSSSKQHHESSKKRKIHSDEESSRENHKRKSEENREKPRLRYINYNPVMYYEGILFHDSKVKTQMPIEIDVFSLMKDCKKRGFQFNQSLLRNEVEDFHFECQWDYVSTYLHKGPKGNIIRLFYINNYLTIGDSFLYATVRQGLHKNKVMQSIYVGSELGGGTLSPGQIKRQLAENLRYITSKVMISFGLHDIDTEIYQNAL
ncbi:unnamed protein product, partial [Allacma fusca]